MAEPFPLFAERIVSDELIEIIRRAATIEQFFRKALEFLDGPMILAERNEDILPVNFVLLHELVQMCLVIFTYLHQPNASFDDRFNAAASVLGRHDVAFHHAPQRWLDLANRGFG